MRGAGKRIQRRETEQGERDEQYDSHHSQMGDSSIHYRVTTKLDWPRNLPYRACDRGPKAGQTYHWYLPLFNRLIASRYGQARLSLNLERLGQAVKTFFEPTQSWTL
jgi:hypothetical protein